MDRRIDDDCSGEPDNGFDPVVYHADADGDGYGVQFPSQVACASPGEGWTPRDGDCNDARPAVHPGVAEVCDEIDNDCNELIDDADPGLDPSTTEAWYRDNDADGFGAASVMVDRCAPPAGYVDNATDCNDNKSSAHPGADELPGDGVDQNCNALEGCYIDADQDGARVEDWAEIADQYCAEPGYAPYERPLDCDDTDPSVNVDVAWLVDDDEDGYGAGLPVVTQCLNPGGGLVPESEVLDCDDEDPDHSPATLEICTDGIDQNCDLRVDCQDSDCLAEPTCLGPCADYPLLSTVPQTQNGNTSGAGNELTPLTCGYSNAPEVAIQWTPPADGTYTFDTVGSGYDTVLYVLQGCDGPEIACNDDTFGLQSQVIVTASAGVPLIIVVDGYSTGSGTFTLNIN
jgi:hypothetical protein